MRIMWTVNIVRITSKTTAPRAVASARVWPPQPPTPATTCSTTAPTWPRQTATSLGASARRAAASATGWRRIRVRFRVKQSNVKLLSQPFDHHLTYSWPDKIGLSLSSLRWKKIHKSQQEFRDDPELDNIYSGMGSLPFYLHCIVNEPYWYHIR